MSDLFSNLAKKPSAKSDTGNKTSNNEYSAAQIEVLEGLEPVRKRPGMYIGGTDERALHHLVAEVLDNSMDEAVAGHANRIDLELAADQTITIRDNGRGIPVDKHPKFPTKSALEVILTTLHSGGKFSDKAYETSGGLHGVGISVVNALSDLLTVEVARDNELWQQTYERGIPTSKLKNMGATKLRGTSVSFHPDDQIFGKNPSFRPERLYRMARSKAYLHRGVTIHWKCDLVLLKGSDIPAEDAFHFEKGIHDFLENEIKGRDIVTGKIFSGQHAAANKQGRIEWALAWLDDDGDGFINSYANTIPTPQGGTHEAGLRSVLAKGLRNYAERIGNKKASVITAEDATAGIAAVLSVFIPDPQFQGQTKDKLASAEATRLVENSLKDHLDHWLIGDPNSARGLIEYIIERAEDRLRKKEQKDQGRKTTNRRSRLPGKLADCARSNAEDTEIFIVEGDSAGGSAKQARDRETQAILPLRGKILNVASATSDKLDANKELADLSVALGCGSGKSFDLDKLRYERVVIMTDADVDGAHIASLLITFFFQQMRGIIDAGRLYLALPPLYRIAQGNKVLYARDDAHRAELLKTEFNGRGKVETSRFKGLGEMPAAQLRDTTMAHTNRTLVRVTLDKIPTDAIDLVERLMGRNPEKRFEFIQANAQFVEELDV